MSILKALYALPGILNRSDPSPLVMDVGKVSLKSVTPALLYGLRLWVSVSDALYIAYRPHAA